MSLQPTEWTLLQSVCDDLWSVWGTPQVDLFATRRNIRLPLYCSPVMDREAWAVDAMLQDWSNKFLYAFPPYTLVRRVINKLARSPGARLILVAPWWPQREWFPDVQRLSIAPPRRLPLRRDLLCQPHVEVFHQGISTLALTAWLLSSGLSDLEASP